MSGNVEEILFQLSQRKDDLEQYHQTLNELSQLLPSREALQHSLITLNKEKLDLSQETEKIKEQIATLKDECQGLEQSLSPIQKEYGEQEEQFKKARLAKEQLQGKGGEELRELHNTIKELENQKIRSQKALQEEKELLHSKVAALKDRIKISSSEIAKIEGWEQQLSTIETEIEEDISTEL